MAKPAFPVDSVIADTIGLQAVDPWTFWTVACALAACAGGLAYRLWLRQRNAVQAADEDDGQHDPSDRPDAPTEVSMILIILLFLAFMFTAKGVQLHLF